MSSGTQKKTQRARVPAVAVRQGRVAQLCDALQRADIVAKLGMCLLAGCAMWAITSGWKPPFSVRTGQVPLRDITARIRFETLDVEGTKEARRLARQKVICIYNHDGTQLEQLREALIEKVRQIVRADSLDRAAAAVWNEFMVGLVPEGTPLEQAEAQATERFMAFREAVTASPQGLEKLESALRAGIALVNEHGLLDALQHDYDRDGGSQTEIRVARPGSPSTQRFNAESLRFGRSIEELRATLATTLPAEVVAHLIAWLTPRLPNTLTWDVLATRKEADRAAQAVEQVMTVWPPGDTLAAAGQPITAESRELLRTEHDRVVAELSLGERAAISAANFGMYAALFLLCGAYCVARQQHLLQDYRTLARILGLMVVTVFLCWVAPPQRWEVILIPLLLFAMTVVAAYEQELALLLSAVVDLLVVVSLGFGLTEFVIFFAAMASAILYTRHIRSRTKLIYVGAMAALVGALTSLGMGTLVGFPIDWPLFQLAGWVAFFSVAAGLLMTGLLPLFIERLFGFQTELSLLELGDVAHPLLQELVRRAPGTYNHSINVASIAESAAEAVGANSLLVRVGAYFHDIGKMLKPGYFIENQGDGHNRHATLAPAMSTLVIIAHVKDGADLARQHKLPSAFVDFIMQHHGTTLVEYFYRRANEQLESDPDIGEVDEHSFRYPGPKPQSKEAAILMLADAVESAGRTLSDPTPARIESLVHELALKRLLDGQFDECGLTLQDLKRIELSLIKSLSAVYHGRIKYPDQQSA